MPSTNSHLFPPQPAATIAQQHFNVRNETPQQQLLLWRERMGSVLDLLPSLVQLEQPFHAWVNSYTVGELGFADLYSDPVRAERSLARISTDSACNCFLFSVCIDGYSHTMEGRYATRSAPFKAKILVVDMDQPIRMQAHRHRMSAFLVPRALMESILPDADALHGRAIDDSSPMARLLIAHAATLNEQIASMSVEEADAALRAAIQLLVAAFGKQARLSGNTRAAARAVMFSQARAYIKKHLHTPDLSAEKVLRALQLPRDTLYRLFQHEGGIAAYINDCRLRAAADEIAHFPHLALKDIAYGLGFNSASAFSRTFRREYDMTPQDLREHAARHIPANSIFATRYHSESSRILSH